LDKKKGNITTSEVVKLTGLGWTTSNVSNHNILLTNIVTQVFEFCKDKQKGRVTNDVTFVTFDLFDYLDMIKQLKKKGLTQEQIGDKLGWIQQQISLYNNIIKKITTEVLNFCKSHQKGRVVNNTTIVVFDFTEGWFRIKERKIGRIQEKIDK